MNLNLILSFAFALLTGFPGHSHKANPFLSTPIMSSKSAIVELDINSSIEIKASRDAVFAIVSDHVGTPNWVDKVKQVNLLKEGKTRNGLGAIREVNFKPALWTTVQEEIVSFKEDDHFHYKVISKMPGMVDHLGAFQLTDLGAGSLRLEWKVYFAFKRKHWFRLFSKSFSKSFKSVQEKGLKTLKEQLEK